jgi:tetratricopeptide (TPR) repeat protein
LETLIVKRFKLIFTALALLLLVAPLSAVTAKDNWTSVRTKNFYLVGNASEKDMRKVATRLEQFRQLISLLIKANLNSSVPINVVVFKSHDAYKPFAPPGTAGYFQPGEDVNYIAVDAQLEGEYPFDVIFHEYTHFLTRNNLPNAPLWFDEGLAEFFSTFTVSKDETRIEIGDPVSNHVFYLREQKLIPLQEIFAVDHRSPLYNESNKKGVFYAESWALVHYLMYGDDRKHFPQLMAFIDKLITNVPVETAFQQAFQTDYKSMEKVLRGYVQHDKYPARVVELTNKVEIDAQMQSAPMSEAEAQFYLGDLLLHAHQLDRAEKYLRQAVALDPNLASARASLGMLEMQKGRFAEAKQDLQRAVAGDSKNFLAHYYYADVLSQEGMDESGLVHGYAPEVAELMRSELKKAIALNPGYPESYRLLAFVNLSTGEQLDESIELLKRAMSLAPGEQRFSYVLAQIYMRKMDFKTARQLLEPIARNTTEPEMQAQAQAMLNELVSMEERMARFKSGGGAPVPEGDGGQPSLRRRDTTGGTEDNQAAGPPAPGERRSFSSIEDVLGKPGAGEERVRGLLLGIECSPKGVTLKVKVSDQVLKLQPETGGRVQFISFTRDVGGGVGCGERNPANEVVVTYRPTKGGKGDGEVVSIAFVPKDFVLKQ